MMSVGFIFDPTDWEIVTFYLQRMVDGDEKFPPGFIHSLDIYECEPWNLLPPDEFKHGPSANLAFFFTPRHPAGSSSKSNKPHARRTVRGGGGGFWHGKAHEIHIRRLGKSGGGPIVGRKTSLNFKTRDGIPTGWMMQEYLLESGSGNNLFQSVALCKIYRKLLHGRRDIDHLQEPPPACYKKQPRVLEIPDAAADHDGLPPPCKRQRRNDLIQVADLLPSSSEDLITTSRGGGQQQYAAAFASGQASALTPIAVGEEDEEEVAAVHSAAASNDFEMFTFAQLMGEEVPVLPEEAAEDRSHNDERFAGLAAQLLGEEEDEEEKEEEMTLPEEANELFASFTQLLEGDKEKVGVLSAEAAVTADCSHNDERFASLAAQLLGEEEEEKEEEEEEMALPAAANEFASFTQLLEGDKKEEDVVVVPATLDNEEEVFHTPARFFWDEYMLTQYDDFCIDDYLCFENHSN